MGLETRPESVDSRPIDITWRQAEPVVRLLGRLLGFLPGADPLYELRLKQAQLEYQRLTGGPLPVAVDFDDLEQQLSAVRSDHIVVGDRGSGKSALAFELALRAKQHDREVHAVGLPDWVCARFGFRSVDRVKSVGKDCFALVDEAGMQVTRGGRHREPGLVEQLAIARHRGTSWCWVAQHAAALDREVLRTEAVIWAKSFDAWRSRFDREELQEWFDTLFGIQAGLSMDQRDETYDAGLTVCYVGSRWFVTRSPLPEGYCEAVSKCWR